MQAAVPVSFQHLLLADRTYSALLCCQRVHNWVISVSFACHGENSKVGCIGVSDNLVDTVVTSTKDVMFHPAFVRPFVCLLAIATSRKDYWSDLRENFTRTLSLDKEELFKFSKSSDSLIRIQKCFKGFFDIARWGIFPHFGSYLCVKADRIFVKFYRKYIFGQVLRIWTTYTLAEVCAVRMLLFVWLHISYGTGVH